MSTKKTGKNIKPMQMPNSVLSLGVILGLLADRLWVAGGPNGLGFVIWVGLFGYAAYWIAQRTRASRTLEIVGWSAVGFSAAVILLFRATPIVVIAMGLVMTVAASMLIMQKNERSLRDTTIADHLIALVRVPKQCILAAFSTIVKVDFGSALLSSRFRAITRGTFLATPLLAIFTILFMSADLTFSRYALEAFNIFSASTLGHLLIIFLFSWATTGLLAGVGDRHFLINNERKALLNLGTEDTAVFLGWLAALFLVFVYLQLGYLFGGRETIEATIGLTRADYARRGFFELLIVAGLTLALLIAVAETNCNKRVFRPLAGLLIACVMIILASAAQRMWLYVIEFGLSIDRITAIAVMMWLAVGLMLFVFTVLRGRTKDFAAGLTTIGILAAFLFALSNPAAIVTGVNIDRAISNGRTVDVGYLFLLGADAIPTLVNNIDKLSFNTRCLTASSLLNRWSSSTEQRERLDWRWWNASHSAANKAVSEKKQQLVEIIDSCWPQH